MGEDNKIQLFENQPIRTAWDEELEEWYFSIIDVVAVLTESKDANAYWRKLNRDKLSRFENEGGRWKEKDDRCCKYRAVVADNSVYSIKES